MKTEFQVRGCQRRNVLLLHSGVRSSLRKLDDHVLALGQLANHGIVNHDLEPFMVDLHRPTDPAGVNATLHCKFGD